MGLGLGFAAGMYVLNLIANMTESAGFLRSITPFGYCGGAHIAAEGRLDLPLVFLGLGYAATMIAAGYRKYCKKDIQ